MSTPRQAVTCKMPPTEPLFAYACLNHAARADSTFSSGHCVSDFSSLKLLCNFSQLCLTEGTSQLQDWNMERKDLEARRQIGELENGKAEEQVVCFRCQ